MGTKRRWNLHHQILTVTALPLICLGIVITLFSYLFFKNTLNTRIETELKNEVLSVLAAMDLMYPGDYHLEGDFSYDLWKGENIITTDYSLIDSIKEKTGMDITLFYYDTRILTTLTDSKGNRIVGTGVHPKVMEDVLVGGNEHFYTNVLVNGIPYFAYYAPLKNSNEENVGMIFAGQPTSVIGSSIQKATMPIFIISLVATILFGLWSIPQSQGIVTSIKKINSFLSHVAVGSLNTSLDQQVLNRNDEIGDMGRNALHMQRSLKKLVEQDALTGIPNRRYGDKRLQQLRMQADVSGVPFCIAIGDIDFFKKVNDTYGHECGDVVLKKVADILKKNMIGKGYVARWGGEEFLLVFEKQALAASIDDLNAILEEVRCSVIQYEQYVVNVTLTFGVAEGKADENLNILLKNADDKLYEGKTGGRNRVIS